MCPVGMDTEICVPTLSLSSHIKRYAVLKYPFSEMTYRNFLIYYEVVNKCMVLCFFCQIGNGHIFFLQCVLSFCYKGRPLENHGGLGFSPAIKHCIFYVFRHKHFCSEINKVEGFFPKATLIHAIPFNHVRLE